MISSIESARFALEQAVERFRSRAISELQVLKDHLPRSGPPERSSGHSAPTSPPRAWAEARHRHHLARNGLIPWRADRVPPRGPADPFRDEPQRPDPGDRSAAPRAARIEEARQWTLPSRRVA